METYIDVILCHAAYNQYTEATQTRAVLHNCVKQVTKNGDPFNLPF